MDDVYQKLSAAVKLWDIDDEANITSLTATEAWLDHASGVVNTTERTVQGQDLQKWLDCTSNSDGPDGTTMVMRFVWVRVDPSKRQILMARSMRKALLQSFGLNLAYQYFQSFSTGIATLPGVAEAHAKRQAYAFSYAPKLAAIWSRTQMLPPRRCQSLVQGLIFVRSASDQRTGQGQDFVALQKAVSQKWDANLLQSAMFPAYVFAMMLGIQVDHTQDAIRALVQQLEARTGYHSFSSRREGPADGDPRKLTAAASGWATKLASVERKRTVTSLLHDWILEQCRTEEEELKAAAAAGNYSPDSWSSQDGITLLRAQVQLLKSRHEFQGLEAKFILKRVETQNQALASVQALNNLDITNDMAQIAHSTYRDAASVKTLAVVTMFFLPGSFVSALFSTPLFSWDDVDPSSGSISVPMTPQLRLYWAITIPLTVLTFVLYFSWLLYQDRQRERARLARTRQALMARSPTVES